MENVAGHSQRGRRSLALRYRGMVQGRVARVATPTFIPPEAIRMPGYTLVASPTLYSGQTVRAGVSADGRNPAPITCWLYIRTYGANDELVMTYGPEAVLKPGIWHEFEWRIGDTGGAPVAEIGVEISSVRRADGKVCLDYLTWDGAPDVVLTRPAAGGAMWRRAWVDGADQFDPRWPEPYRIVQNQGTGLLIQGTREWTDYRVSSVITLHLIKSGGIGARVQGMRRYYALLLCTNGKARLVKALDGNRVLAETDYPWEFGEAHEFGLQVVGNYLEASIDGQTLFSVEDIDRPLAGGGIALICEEGCLSSDAVVVQPWPVNGVI